MTESWLLALPTDPPYRVNQVTSDPLLLALLFTAQLLLATGLQRGWRPRFCVVMLLVAVGLFFTLASWGTSDVTKLSVKLVQNPQELGWAEPFWLPVGLLLPMLPYRFALVHGLVVAGYAALGMGWARWHGLPRWGGWWALLVVTNPFLYLTLRNGVTRQALCTLLLVPLWAWAMGLVRLPLPVRWGGLLLALTSHGTAPMQAVLALLPRLWLTGLTLPRPRRWLAAVLPLAGLLALVLPWAWTKLRLYLQVETYFPTYALRPLPLAEEALVVALLALVWWRHGVKPPRGLAAHGSLLVVLQLSVHFQWAPQITHRFVDPVALACLLLLLAWTAREGRPRWLLPLLLLVLGGFGFELLQSDGLGCGHNDGFFCLPDRWPWLVVY